VHRAGPDVFLALIRTFSLHRPDVPARRDAELCCREARGQRPRRFSLRLAFATPTGRRTERIRVILCGHKTGLGAQLGLCHTAPVSYHETFWVVAGTAAPVIALAAVVALPDTAGLYRALAQSAADNLMLRMAAGKIIYVSVHGRGVDNPDDADTPGSELYLCVRA
jgi:hypothetical protein